MNKTILKGDWFTLRPVKITDAEKWVKWSKDKDTMKYTGVEPLTIKKEKIYFKSIIKNKKDLNFSILIKNKHIGGTSLHLDLKHKKSGLGIVIADKKFHDKGWGTKIVKLLLKYSFEKLQLNKVFLKVFTENKRAQKIYRRCGFKKVGLLKDDFYKNKKFYDQYEMEILKSEYIKKYK